jgi:hypothetical protein
MGEQAPPGDGRLRSEACGSNFGGALNHVSGS